MVDSTSKPDVGTSPPTAFEVRLAADPRWALSEGSQFFEGTGAVQKALRKICKRLNELGVPYAVVGGMALFQHGYRRFTEDVDILVTREGLKTIHKALEGLGYKRPFEKSKNLRDTEEGVKIEFLLTGSYPGDGKPQQVQFPDPASVTVEQDGVKFLNLPTLVELKLASGMTGSDRIKDLADVQELIKLLTLPEDFAIQLSESVRAKYAELWRDVHRRQKRYVTTWRNKFLTTEAKSLDEMIAILRDAAEQLDAMRTDGVFLDPDGGTADDYATLVTTDPEIAKKYGMEDESELWEENEEDNDAAE
ncbi:MAG TPA: nucleotidyltransferase family protein [Pirellulales bacterium]